MSLPLLIQGLGSIGVFASRAFLPAFATALLLRFGPQVPWLAQAGLLPHVRDVPTWFTSDTALVVLGLLAAAGTGRRAGPRGAGPPRRGPRLPQGRHGGPDLPGRRRRHRPGRGPAGRPPGVDVPAVGLINY